MENYADVRTQAGKLRHTMPRKEIMRRETGLPEKYQPCTLPAPIFHTVVDLTNSSPTGCLKLNDDTRRDSVGSY